MAHIGHPLLGDLVYGSGFKSSARRLNPAAQAALRQLQRQALHAAELAFEHPVSGQALAVYECIAADMAELAKRARGAR